jgi:hypothetical protein
VNIGVIKGLVKTSASKQQRSYKMNPRNWQMIFVNSVTALLLIVISSIVFAYPDYDGCKDCHGGFEDNNYVSKSDSANWNESLMDGHETFADDECL